MKAEKSLTARIITGKKHERIFPWPVMQFALLLCSITFSTTELFGEETDLSGKPDELPTFDDIGNTSGESVELDLDETGSNSQSMEMDEEASKVEKPKKQLKPKKEKKKKRKQQRIKRKKRRKRGKQVSYPSSAFSHLSIDAQAGAGALFFGSPFSSKQEEEDRKSHFVAPTAVGFSTHHAVSRSTLISAGASATLLIMKNVFEDDRSTTQEGQEKPTILPFIFSASVGVSTYLTSRFQLGLMGSAGVLRELGTEGFDLEGIMFRAFPYLALNASSRFSVILGAGYEYGKVEWGFGNENIKITLSSSEGFHLPYGVLGVRVNVWNY